VCQEGGGDRGHALSARRRLGMVMLPSRSPR
jgi:hypothetical protein